MTTFVAITLDGCASYTQHTVAMRQAYRDQRYDQALKDLDASAAKHDARNRLLYPLEKSMILDRLGQGTMARTQWQDASRLVDELFTVSLTKAAATFLVNEQQQDYAGEDYEKVAIHTMSALSFLGDQDLAAARVEARRINERLYALTEKLGDQHNSYREDAFARFLSGTVYEALGDDDDAIVDYRRAVDLYAGRGFQSFYVGGVPPSLVQALLRIARRRQRDDVVNDLTRRFPQLVKSETSRSALAALGTVVVVHEVGSITLKEAKEFVFPFGNQLIRFSFPYIPLTTYAAQTRCSVEALRAGQSVAVAQGVNVANMSAIAHHTLEDRRGRLLLKGAARLIAKGQMVDQAYRNFGPLGGLAANVFTAVTETADTRSWSLLPAAFFVTRISLPPGEYHITLRTGYRRNERSITLQAGEFKFLRHHDV